MYYRDEVIRLLLLLNFQYTGITRYARVHDVYYLDFDYVSYFVNDEFKSKYNYKELYEKLKIRLRVERIKKIKYKNS